MSATTRADDHAFIIGLTNVYLIGLTHRRMIWPPLTRGQIADRTTRKQREEAKMQLISAVFASSYDHSEVDGSVTISGIQHLYKFDAFPATVTTRFVAVILLDPVETEQVHHLELIAKDLEQRTAWESEPSTFGVEYLKCGHCMTTSTELTFTYREPGLYPCDVVVDDECLGTVYLRLCEDQ